MKNIYFLRGEKCAMVVLKKQYTLWKLMIDEQYQNKGYGIKALKLAINWLVNNLNVKEVYTGVFENTIAENLYYSFGFRKTGESDESQFEMKLIIENWLFNFAK